MKTTQIKELLEKAQLDWTVSTHQIETVDTRIEIPKRLAVIRDDDDTFLGMVSPQYEVFQNEELMELLVKISASTGLTLHSGGYFKGGKKVYIQLKSSDWTLPDGDQIKGHLTGLNSHDGTRSLAFGNWMHTVSCQNTWYMAYKELETRVRHHTSILRPKIEEVLRQVDKALNNEKKIIEEVTRMQTYEIDEAIQLQVIAKWFDLHFVDDHIEDIPKSTLLRMAQLNEIMEMEMQEKGQTAWGAFSGVTKFTTHILKKGKDTTEDKLFGDIGTREKRMYDYLLQTIK